ncbi:hypothetical protein [Aliiroseovarius crassostreae]|uniref:hypothetical protein n=1 Tax=Aliiroseovarius crassostreae TaxID=154981 RepID=UPI003C7AC125
MYSLVERLYSSAENDVIRPLIAAKGRRFNNPITRTSPRWQRAYAVQLRRYLSLEMGSENGYGCIWDESPEGWEDTEFIPLLDSYWCPDRVERQALIGGLSFKKDGDLGWVLEFAWLHPFHRHKGKLQALWGEAKARYGNSFEISPPVSNAMESFLNKVEHPCGELWPER